MRMMWSLGAGMLATVGLFTFVEWATTCQACVNADDGGLGTTFLFAGLLLVPMGIVPAYLKRRRA